MKKDNNGHVIMRRRKGFFDWLVEFFLPGCHIAKNPKKHTKKRRKKAEVNDG